MLYGPNDPTCTTAMFTSNLIPVSGNGTYTSTPGFTPVAAGTYLWRAFYSGDANNAPVSGVCGAANESADITGTTPTIATTASAGGPLGTVLTDQATLVGRCGADRQHHVRAVRPERRHLRDGDLHVERDSGERQRHLCVGAGLHAGGGGDVPLARVLQR